MLFKGSFVKGEPRGLQPVITVEAVAGATTADHAHDVNRLAITGLWIALAACRGNASTEASRTGAEERAAAAPGVGNAVSGTGVAGPSVPRTPVGAPPPVAVAGAADGVEIVAPGAEPRRPLRYHFRAGALAKLAVEVDFDRTGPTGSGPLPTMTLALNLEVLAVAADGAATIRTTVTSVDARSRPGANVAREQVLAQADLLVGAVITSTVSPVGATHDTKVTLAARDATADLVAQASAQLRDFEKLAMRLPADPIGVGGSWKYVTRTAPLGSEVTMTTTVTVTSIAGDRIGYTSVTAISGDDHGIVDHGMRLDIHGIGGTGTATGAFDLASPLSVVASALTLKFEMIAQAVHQPVAMTTATRITDASAPAAPGSSKPPSPSR